MSRLRKTRPSPAIVVALVALVFAMTSTAISATHYLITSTKQISPKVLRKLQGGRGPQGPVGPRGDSATINGVGAGGALAGTYPNPSLAPLASLQPIAVNTVDWMSTPGFGARSPAAYVDQLGIVHLQGAVAHCAASVSPCTCSGPSCAIGTLPGGMNPGANVFLIAHTFAGTYADLVIGTDGSIAVITPASPAVEDLRFTSLEGITFRR